jgi:hypothetical protein
MKTGKTEDLGKISNTIIKIIYELYYIIIIINESRRCKKNIRKI